MANLGSFFIPFKNKIISMNTDLKTISTQGIYLVQGYGVGINDDGTMLVLNAFSGNQNNENVKLFLGVNGNLYFYSSKGMDNWVKIYSSQI